MRCARCSLELPPGARHPDATSCLEALQHENAVLNAKLGLACPKCNLKPVCACDVKRVAKTEIHKRSPGAAQMLQILGKILE